MNAQPLKGKTIAVSALKGSDDDDDEVSQDAPISGSTTTSSRRYTYKTLRALCESLGANVTGQVHRRTDCVIATHTAAAAVDGTTTKQHHPTQRVRKAWKLQIPVVSVQWIEDCRTRRQCLPFEPLYLWLEESWSIQQQTRARPPKRRRTDDDDDEEEEAVSAVQQKQKQRNGQNNKDKKPKATHVGVALEKKLDLGCCCLCHDDDSDLQTSECPWCVNCSVRT